MAKTAKRATGDIGEEVVCKYLINKGFSVVERNYLRKWGEIDIIAQKGAGGAKKLYFVEVKTVRLDSARQVTRDTGQGRGSRVTGLRPEENMTRQKVLRLRRAVQTYLVDHKVPPQQVWQFDLACVYLDYGTKRARVELLEDIIL